MVWLAREPIPGSAEAIGRLRAAGAAVVFVTNDPRSTREELAERLTGIGAPTDPGAVLTSATVAARTAAAEHPGGRVLVAGSEALAAEHRAVGLEPVEFEPGAEADLVAVGGGWALSSERLAIAARAVRDGAELWATNADPTYPTPSGPAPGTGALVAALEVASGVEARILGKPETAIFDGALERLDCERPLMAGDSLRSDIAGASRAGLSTALILTGHDSRETAADAEVQPDLIYEDLATLADDLA